MYFFFIKMDDKKKTILGWSIGISVGVILVIIILAVTLTSNKNGFI